MKDTRAPSKMKLMGGRELTDVLGANFESMVALHRQLLGYPFVPVAKLAGLKLTPGQKEQLEGLIRGVILTRNTGEKIAECLAGMVERDARGQGRAPLSLVMGESLRLGVGAAYAVSLCYQALRLYEEVTGKAMPEASGLTAELADIGAKLADIEAKQADFGAKQADFGAKQADFGAKLDTIQTHTAGVPAMVEELRDDDARAAGRAAAYEAKMKLTERQRQIWTMHSNGFTQEQVTARLKCSIRTIRRDSQAINDAFARAGRAKPITWNHRKSKDEVRRAWYGAGATADDDNQV